MAGRPKPATDMTDHTAGCWVVRSRASDGPTQDDRLWGCECTQCGRERVMSERAFNRLAAARRAVGGGAIQGCSRGCQQSRLPVSPGDVFGLWTVQPGDPVVVPPRTLSYPVRCRCGHEQYVRIGALTKGSDGGSGGCRSCMNKAAAARKRGE